jgi:hypothetical protein
MSSLAPKDLWLVGLLLLSALAYVVAARLSGRFTTDRPMVIYAAGFSLVFVLLSMVAGLAVFR